MLPAGSGVVAWAPVSSLQFSPVVHPILHLSLPIGISSLIWSPTQNILASTNWDSGVRVWEVAEQGGHIQANPKSKANHENQAPALASCFSPDGSKLFSGGCDKAVRMWQLGQTLPSNGVPQQIGAHDAPVSCFVRNFAACFRSCKLVLVTNVSH
jgi:WD40 repeat protein